MWVAIAATMVAPCQRDNYAIRARRGERGLTPLDGTLLHVPPIAAGWNSLLGAIRNKGQLPGDVRELMILRVAVWNRAAFEWIQHEIVGRAEGLSTKQLQAVRDSDGLLGLPGSDVLPSLHQAALVFADSSTKDIQVPPAVSQTLMNELRRFVVNGEQFDKTDVESTVQDLYVEAAATVATYNMVSRFLVSTDVAGLSDAPVPWPSDKQEHKIPFPNSPNQAIHVVTHVASPDAPWVILSNSLITDHTMWDPLLPFLSAPQKSSKPFNIITFDQRGHGVSGLPPPPTTDIPSPTSPLHSGLRQATIAQ
ncbi:hypothetical protein ONZ45_g19601 [Pleurotus djamor]|nr:hypothetical protein ONZ45_g19601 [Pleurotus djamor]